MATPKCPKCGLTLFEVQQLNAPVSNFAYLAVNCAACGCIISVQPFENTSILLHNLAEKLGHPLD